MEKKKYEAIVCGECLSDTHVIEAKTATAAKRMARKYLQPYQSNWQWFGSVVLTKVGTANRWILEAGHESKGWQEYPFI